MVYIQGGHHGLTEVHTWKNILYPFNDFEDIEFCVVYGWVRLHICRDLVASDKVSVCLLCVFDWVLCKEGLVPALFDCPETSSRHSRTGFMLEKWYFSQYCYSMALWQGAVLLKNDRVWTLLLRGVWNELGPFIVTQRVITQVGPLMETSGRYTNKQNC